MTPRIFETLDEMWLNVCSEVVNKGSRTGSRDGQTTEILGVVLRLSDPRSCFVFNPARGLQPWYPAAELIWYLSGEQSPEMIKAYAPRYDRFANDPEESLQPTGLPVPRMTHAGRYVHGAYGNRWARGDLAFQQVPDLMGSVTRPKLDGVACTTQMAALISLLQRKQETRQAVLTCWNAGDLLYSIAGTMNDLPCTLTLQFIVRDGKLNLLVNMRSNDVWLGLTNDVFCFCHLQMIIAQALQLELGFYQHTVGSMHIYDRDMDKIKAALNGPGFDTEPLVYDSSNGHYVSGHIAELVKLEAWNRKINGSTKDTDGVLGGSGSLFSQILHMASSRWADTAVKKIHNKRVQKILLKWWENRRASGADH